MKQLQLGIGLILMPFNWLGLGFNSPLLPLERRAIAAETPAAQDNLHPQNDRNLIIGDTDIYGARLYPDGEFLAFQKPLDGVVNVWVKDIDEPMEAARPVTADAERPINIYFWSADGRYILYAQDQGGNENFQIYAVDPESVGETAPVVRNLTPIEGVSAQIFGVPKQTPNNIIIGLNDRDPRFHDVYQLDLTSGERTLIYENDENVARWMVDSQGTVRLAYRQSQEGINETLVVNNGALTPIYTCAIEETCYPIRFHRDGQQVYLMTNRDQDLIQLELLDLTTGQSQLVEADPENQVDFGNAVFSEATDELIATAYVGDRVRIYPQDDRFAADLAFLQQQFPNDGLSLTSLTQDDQLALIGVQSDVNPGSMYLFDRSAQTLEKLYDYRPELPSESLATMEPVRYTARDGLEIPAYLTLPPGIAPVN